MCNLYKMRRTVDEVAKHFGVKEPPAVFNTPEETLPGYPGLVMREDNGKHPAVDGMGLPDEAEGDEARRETARGQQHR